MHMKKILGIILLVGTGGLLVACNNSETRMQAPPPVTYSIVEKQKISLSTELPGRVSAFVVSEVRPQVSGIITERLFEEGADVEAGQVLYRIDPALFQAEVKSAEANLAMAEAGEMSARRLAERYATVVASNSISRQEYDNAKSAALTARAEVEAAREALRTAQINLSYTEVTAPVSGRVGRSFITPGALVTANQGAALCTIQHLDRVYVDVTQSNVQMLRLRRAAADGQVQTSADGAIKVRLILEDGTPYARTPRNSMEAESVNWIVGELLFSEVSIDKGTGVVTMRAKFYNPQGLLLPGMYVRAVIEEGEQDGVILVPQRAVLKDNQSRPYVYVLSSDGEMASGEESVVQASQFRVEMRFVEIVRNVGSKWLISSGLNEGDRLMIDGQVKAAPDALVSGRLLPEGSVLSAGREPDTLVR